MQLESIPASLRIKADRSTCTDVLSLDREITLRFSAFPGTESVTQSSESFRPRQVSVDVQTPLFQLIKPRVKSPGTW